MDIIEYLKFKNFTIPELQKVCFPAGTSVTQIDYYSLMRLQKARDYLCEPIRLTCAYRSVEWDKQHGRNGLSSHCKGQAFDIACRDKRYRFRLICALIRAGFTRIGVYPTFVHADDDSDKPEIFWITEQQL